jgi:hypothetical protein
MECRRVGNRECWRVGETRAQRGKNLDLGLPISE